MGRHTLVPSVEVVRGLVSEGILENFDSRGTLSILTETKWELVGGDA